jgi:hypothetical protein
MTAVTPSREALTYLPVCAPCVRGEGSECHTPGCALFLRDVPTDGLIAEFALDLDTLVGDEALVEAACRAVLHRWPVDEPIHDEDREQIRHAFRALGAVLSERGDR